MTAAATVGPASSRSARGDFLFRIASSLVLAGAALLVAILGGPAFAAFWGLAAAGVAAEWVRLSGGTAVAPPAFAAACVLAATVVALVMSPVSALSVMFAGAFILGAVAGPAAALAMPYAAPIVLGPILLRADPLLGLAAVLWLFAVVWGTDIAAYFVGRRLGGPKLWPAVSPGKTWSGAIGGALAGMLGGVAVAAFAGVPLLWPVALLALAASILAQAGDLFESAVKRRAGVKDSGRLIPGHGGLMDRLDGFAAAAAFAVVVGTIRGGADAAGQGLLAW